MILGDLLGQILVDDSAAGFLAVAVQFFDKFREELILPELPECFVFRFYMFIRNMVTRYTWKPKTLCFPGKRLALFRKND